MIATAPVKVKSPIEDIKISTIGQIQEILELRGWTEAILHLILVLNVFLFLEDTFAFYFNIPLALETLEPVSSEKNLKGMENKF